MSMNRCRSCEGFVPQGAESCPNCRSTRRAWWIAPLSLAGAGLASVTLSACYGPGCATAVTLPDGGTRTQYGPTCAATYDCRTAITDGGVPENDPDWDAYCVDHDVNRDAGTDAGVSDGGTDGGI